MSHAAVGATRLPSTRSIRPRGRLFGALIATVVGLVAPEAVAWQADAGAPTEAATAARPDRGLGVSDEAEATFRGRNGEIFRDWPTPRAVIVFTGELDGYIEPCGCTGKENQKGGLSRRRNFLGALRRSGWPIVAVDLGDQVGRYGPQSAIKFQSIVDGLKIMDYAAVGFGPKDLRLPTEAVLAAVSPVNNQPTPFLSANVGLLGLDSGLIPRFRVVEEGGLKFGITAIVGDREAGDLNNDSVDTRSAAAALEETSADLAKAGCDHQVLLSFASPEETEKLAARFPQFDFVVTAGGAEEPPAEPQLLPPAGKGGKSVPKRYLLELGHKGMFAVVVGLFDDPNEPLRWQRVALDARWGEAEDMIRLLGVYQAQLETLGLAGLGLTKSLHPGGRRFAGSDSCADCHKSSHDVWAGSGHAHALTTLQEQSPKRDGDPECLSCHVVGWVPQKFVPYEGGFMGVAATPHLGQQGCENCHGPAAAHDAVERGTVPATAADRDRLRAQLRREITTPEGKQRVVSNCLECHDLDNSPKFDFDTYWPEVEHSEDPGAAAAAAAALK